jgi:hypothetical protein
MNKALKIAAVIAVIIVAVIMLVYMFGPYNSFLELLNSQIVKGCEFRPFYAGVDGLPRTRDVIPALGALEDEFDVVRREGLMVLHAHLAAKKGAPGMKEVPRMDSTYNQIFLRGAGEGPAESLRKYVMKSIYGKDVDIFDKIGSDDWRTFNLILYNQDVEGNVEKCPNTVRLLKNIPGMQSALISIIAPGTYIPPHSDPAKGVIRYHLALKVPKDRSKCFIEVSDENGKYRYHWKEGKGVLFDDVYDHWVQNSTDEYRVILFVDILRPLKGVPKYLQALANAANRYHPGVRRAIRHSRV